MRFLVRFLWKFDKLENVAEFRFPYNFVMNIYSWSTATIPDKFLCCTVLFPRCDHDRFVRVHQECLDLKDDNIEGKMSHHQLNTSDVLSLFQLHIYYYTMTTFPIHPTSSRIYVNTRVFGCNIGAEFVIGRNFRSYNFLSYKVRPTYRSRQRNICYLAIRSILNTIQYYSDVPVMLLLDQHIALHQLPHL